MSDDLCPARTGTDAAHCWHDGGYTLSNQESEHICCYCGKQRKAAFAANPQQHGPYMPRFQSSMSDTSSTASSMTYIIPNVYPTAY